MATDLSIRLYFSTPSSVERFGALVEAVGSSADATGAWSGFEVSVRRPLHRRVQREGALTSTELRGLAAATGLGTAESIVTRTALRCWRQDGAAMVNGQVMAYVEVSGDEYIRLNLEDVRMGGQAAVTLSHAAPFVVDISGLDTAYNQKVEDNLDRLSTLVVHLANALDPDAIRLFTDDGLYLPFNAHALYCRGVETVLDDLTLIREVWKRGLPLHRVEPLAYYRGGSQDGALHLGRTPEQRRELWQRLTAALANMPTSDDVRAVLGSGRFDTLTKGDAFVVLEYPHYVNAFVARFYLEVLERAAK